MSSVIDQQDNRMGLRLVNQLKCFYANMDAHKMDGLREIYTQDIEFVDPIDTTKGLFALKNYLSKQSVGLNYCRFNYVNELVGTNQAFIRWEMIYSHPKLAKGKELTLMGMSEIHYTQKIYYQHDSYDLGAMLYQNIPLLGGVVRFLKSRLS